MSSLASPFTPAFPNYIQSIRAVRSQNCHYTANTKEQMKYLFPPLLSSFHRPDRKWYNLGKKPGFKSGEQSSFQFIDHSFMFLALGNNAPLSFINSPRCLSSTVLSKWCSWILLATLTCVRTWRLVPTSGSAFWECHSKCWLIHSKKTKQTKTPSCYWSFKALWFLHRSSMRRLCPSSPGMIRH